MSHCLKIHLDDKKPPTGLWKTSSWNEIKNQFIPHDQKIEILSTSVKEDLVYKGEHPLLEGYVFAFCEHRPITITPDIIWLLIIQGFTHHVAANSEKFKNEFVKFNGVETLKVKKNMFPEEATEKDWMEIFDELADQISSFTGSELIENLTSNFTTTTPVSKAASQLTIMAAMQNYFVYDCSFCGCGLPYINLEGSVEDWRKILEKVKFIEKFDLEWWTSKLIPIINECIYTKEGKGPIHRKFWKDMIRICVGEEEDYLYDEISIDGWICSFFPYDTEGNKRSIQDITQYDSIPSEMIPVPFNLISYLPWEDPANKSPIECEFRSGFIGLKQDSMTFEIKPEIGWIVHKGRIIQNKDEVSRCDFLMNLREHDHSSEDA
ncbi:hypothetical protein TRFO_07698 [Tritrichomonas foetus]|uniref:DUF4419 domain-containing protein n=1 Tax=Tritrichomonas foetus TaxID=1144522 RepID=A0A1J4JPG4_9EUKA|nr:hypothetical protein TRFO_07698 [Tritrichomonas foetus]|eukprot:OHT01025.1 hypothetical protein TRFO_07698 [Tritrichomonas foetus]